MRAALGVLVSAAAILAVSPSAASPSGGTTEKLVVPSTTTRLLIETLDGTVTGEIGIPPDFDLYQNNYSVASDGTVAFIDEGRYGGIWLVKPGGGAPTEVDANPYDQSPSITYDGSRVAFTRSTSGGGADIYVVNTDGTGLERVASGGPSTLLSLPRFSPDGDSIAYICQPKSFAPPVEKNCGPQTDGLYRSSGLMLMNADGADKRMIVQHPGGNLANMPESLTWAPNGKWLAMDGLFPMFVGGGQTALNQICVYPSNGSGLFWQHKGAVTHLTDWQHDGIGFPTVSPDSTQIVYFDPGEGSVLINRNGGDSRLLPLTSGWGWDFLPQFIPPAVGGATPPTMDATHVVVPNLHGLRYLPAREKLLRMHMSVGLILRRHSRRISKGRVLAERPVPGTVLHRVDGAKPPVDLVLSSGGRR